jgi:hypothetical protein
MMRRHAAHAALLLLVLVRPSPAQDYPFLPEPTVRWIAGEISGDAAYEHVRFMTRFHRPRGGSDGLWAVAEYFDSAARAFGLEDVRLIKQASTTRPWNARFADLWIVGPQARRIASTLQHPLHLADYSRPADITAELVYIGGGGEADFERTDVRGRIVLTHGPLALVMREAVGIRGALGVVWYPSPYSIGTGTDGGGLSRPDQVRWLSLPAGAIGGVEPTFAFGLSARHGAELRNALLASGDTPIRVRAVVDAAFTSLHGEEPWDVMVEAYIRGSAGELGQDIVLTAHLQEEKTSANDDASGSASILEVARALQRLIDEGRIERPRRNLRFWWVREFGSQRQYFADDPDAHRSIWVNVNQDMVGADQSQDVMRKQNVTRLPASRFHFFNDVVEATIEYMVATNTSELAQIQAGIPLYPRPHVAHFGSMHRYNAEMIFFHANTDHVPFLEAPIGVPAITFTNMPDRFIHSSDDDLWNIDATQLGRNAVAAALIAYTMATADDALATTIAAETVGRGAERIGRNLRLGLSWIARDDDRDVAYRNAADQIAYAAERERLAIRSLAEISPAGGVLVDALVQENTRREQQALRELELACRQATAGRQPPARPPANEVEARLRTLRPVLAAGPREFHTLRGQIPAVPGLHALMGMEVLNAIDGERTGLDIHRYVAAQAREAGAHYYGAVTAQAVEQYLRNVERVGVVRMR